MDDLTPKLPTGALQWTISFLGAGGLLKGMSVLLNKVMDRKMKQDEYGHQDSATMTAKVWARMDAQDARIEVLNKALDESYEKFRDAVSDLKIQTMRLEHCNATFAEASSHIAALEAEVAVLNSQVSKLNDEVARLNGLLLKSYESK